MRGSATSSTIGATELPNHRLEPPASSVRSYLAPACGGGSGAALAATEVTFEPGGYVSEHHHVGPHIVFVLSGELTSVLNGKTTVYKAGEYFYEPGNVTHAAFNKTSLPLVVIGFDILPAEWKGRAVLPPKSQ